MIKEVFADRLPQVYINDTKFSNVSTQEALDRFVKLESKSRSFRINLSSPSCIQLKLLNLLRQDKYKAVAKESSLIIEI